MVASNPFCPCFSPNSVLFSDLDEAARSEQVRVYLRIRIIYLPSHVHAYVGYSCIIFEFLNYKAITLSGHKELSD